MVYESITPLGVENSYDLSVEIYATESNLSFS